MRKATLLDRTCFTGALHPAVIQGSVLHEIAQEAMLHDSFDKANLEEIAHRTTADHIVRLYHAGEDEQSLFSNIQDKLDQLNSWSRTFWKTLVCVFKFLR